MAIEVEGEAKGESFHLIPTFTASSRQSRILASSQKMGDNQGSSDEDEWGMEELPLPTLSGNKAGLSGNNNNEKVDDSYWEEEAQEKNPQLNSSLPKPSSAEESVEKEDGGGEPMILVDMTALSEGAIHSKFDRNSVNDSVAASNLRRKIEEDYTTYARKGSLVADGTVIPCGTTVWREALVQLRDERAGHYFAPIFPPKR
jgi:hypothetical protein